MWREIGFEITKLRAQKKNHIAVVGHLVLMGLVVMGLKLSHFQGPAAQAVRNGGLELRDFVDGLFFARGVFVPTMLMILPIFICTLVGDMVAGEVQDGSLKLHAARPRTRTSILLAKAMAMALAATAYCFYFALVSLVAGIAVFGWPGMQVVILFGTGLPADFSVMGPEAALLRYGICTLFHVGSVIALGCVTLFFSTVFNRMTSATIAGLTLYFVCYIVDGLPWLEELKPYLLSRAMNGSVALWLNVIPWGRIVNDLAILGIYAVLFLGAATVLFNAKDIR